MEKQNRLIKPISLTEGWWKVLEKARADHIDLFLKLQQAVALCSKQIARRKMNSSHSFITFLGSR